MRYLLPILMFVSLLGCVPYSDNPLTDPSEQALDSSIYGSWFWKDENESGYVHIGLDKESHLLRVVMLEFDRNGELNVSEFSAHTSSLEDKAYLNLRWIRPADENPGYLLVKYQVRDERLGISLMDGSAAEKAIKEGLLKGKVGDDNWAGSIQITEEQGKWQQFVGRNDKELFRETVYLHRLWISNERFRPDGPARE